LEQDGGHAQLWDARTGRLERTLAKGLIASGPIRFSHDEALVLVGGNPVRMFDANTGKELHALSHWTESSPEGSLLVSRIGSAFALFDAANGHEFCTVSHPNLEKAQQLTFAGDNQLISVHRSDGIRIWDLGRIRHQLAERGLDWEGPASTPIHAVANHAPPRVELAMGDLDAIRPKLLAENFNRSVQAAPHLSVRWTLRGRFHRDAGRYAEALRDIRAALERVKPTNPRNVAKICDELARFHITAPANLRDVDEAVTMAKRAIELCPGEWAYHTTLGMAYYRAGRFDEAVGVLSLATQTSSGQSDPAAHYFLAMCYHRIGDLGRAKSSFDTAKSHHALALPNLTKENDAQLKRFCEEAQRELAHQHPSC
jgi:tetratricopeptide (TPR) repeat protein